MTDLFDGGHRQLFAAECSGLSAAWRRAAETVVEHPDDDLASPPPHRLAGARALLAAAAVTLVAGLCFIAVSTDRPDEQVVIESSVTAQSGEWPEYASAP